MGDTCTSTQQVDVTPNPYLTPTPPHTPSSYLDGWPYKSNLRYSLNIQPQHRGDVFGCLLKGLFGFGSEGGGVRGVLAGGVKVGGLHATNTQRSSPLE